MNANEIMIIEGIVQVNRVYTDNMISDEFADVDFATNKGMTLSEYLVTKEGKKVKVIVEILD